MMKSIYHSPSFTNILRYLYLFIDSMACDSPSICWKMAMEVNE